MDGNRIKKALLCCSDQMYSCSDKQCKAKTLGDAIVYMDIQKAEIEKLKEQNEFHRETIRQNAQRALEVTMEDSERARSEAIREFAERLKQKAYPFPCAIGVEYAVTIRAINDLVKEMTEE